MKHVARGLAIVAVALLAVLPFFACQPKVKDDPFGNSSGVKVAVSFPALYSLAANVVGDTGVVKSVKSTQGAHGSEVTADELSVINAADLFFINGLGLDDEFAKKLKASSNNPTVTTVDLGGTLNKKKHGLMLHSDGPCLDGDTAHDHGGHDPHIWMGLPQAVRLVDYICDALSEKYPEHKSKFLANAEGYKEKLKAIQAEGEAILKGTPEAERKIVTAHGSMAYFADTFDITVVDTIQKAAGKEPSKQQLETLIANCKKEGVRVIASEPQFSKAGGVKTLAEEMKRLNLPVVVIELDNMEAATADDLKGDWYEVKMRANIAALKDAFGK
jgi:zinc transport system substrate-binding protein